MEIIKEKDEGAISKLLRIKDQLRQYKRNLEDMGYHVYGVYLKGSQNYNLDDMKSDIDAVAVVIPSLKQLCKRESLSKKYVMEQGEVLVNDIYTFATHTCKGNSAWVELVHTQYFIGETLWFLAEVQVNPKSVYGQMCEKVKALTKEYPSKVEEIAKWGFDPKQLHHAWRNLDLLMETKAGKVAVIKRYEHDSPRRTCLIDLKRGDNLVELDINVTNVEEIGKQALASAKVLVDALVPHYVQTPVPEQIIEDILEEHLKKRFMKGVK